MVPAKSRGLYYIHWSTRINSIWKRELLKDGKETRTNKKKWVVNKSTTGIIHNDYAHGFSGDVIKWIEQNLPNLWAGEIGRTKDYNTVQYFPLATLKTFKTGLR